MARVTKQGARNVEPARQLAESRPTETRPLEDQQLYHSLFESMLNGCAYCRMLFEDGKPTDFIYLAVNDSFVAQTGLKDVVGRKVSEIIPGIREADPGIFEIYGRVALTGRPEHFEMFVESLHQWFAVSAYSPSREHFVAVFDVVTERKRAEERLRQSEAFTRAVMDHLPIGVAVNSVDPAVDFTYMNDNFPRFYRTTREALAAADAFWEHVYQDPGFREAIRNRVLADCAEGDPARMHWEDVPITRTGEETTYICARNIPVPGEPLMISTVWDVTERKRTEEALRESELRYRALFENSLDAILLTVPDGRILSANPAACQMFGRSEEEICTLGLGGVVDMSDPRLPALLEERRRTEQARGELTFVRRDGSTFPGEVSSVIFKDRSGDARSSMIIRDVTERRRAEQERARLQAQLLQAQKMESVGRLAGGVAHDFNNMLEIILGHADLSLEKVEAGQPLHADLLEIKKAAERSADLTRQLLAFARKQTVTPRVLDLNETVEGMLKMLRRLIGEDIELAWRPGPGLWPVRVDPSQVDQILANLCVNSRDAIEGVGTIGIETNTAVFDETYCAEHPGCAPGEYVVLAVSDNGAGMDRATMDRLFEPFFTTKEVGKGTGLGLATVYGIVKQNDGFITVYSEPGLGSTFKIYLPRHAAAAEPAPPDGAPAPEGRGQETILVVEDETAILRMTTRILEAQGYRVLSASTPGEAIRLAKEHPGDIHLLVTDVVMPEMNGRELARNVMALYPDIKRLFTSGYTADVIAHHGVIDEGVNFIQKPYSKQLLAAKVREALDRA
jgi:PAS domain S-box-containing protein